MYYTLHNIGFYYARLGYIRMYPAMEMAEVSVASLHLTKWRCFRHCILSVLHLFTYMQTLSGP